MSQGNSQTPEVEIEITLINAIACGVKRQQAKYVVPALEYERSYWRQGPKRKEKVKYTDHFLIQKGKHYFIFLTGHLRLVLKYCREHNYKINFVGERPSTKVAEFEEPYLRGIELRPDQLKLINAACLAKRGVIKAPTRYGKTAVQYGIISAFNGRNALILAHTKDLVSQLADDGDKYGYDPAVVHGTKKQLNWATKGQVVVMTRQTCANLIKTGKMNKDYFDLIIVDEGHHVSSQEGQYADILTFYTAPLRYAFTATLPDNIEAEMSLEGYIGPLIGEITQEEAEELGITVRPQIIIKKAPLVEVPKWADYQTAYERGIIENHERHLMIAMLSEEFNNQGMSVLILVTKVQHGFNLVSAFREISVLAHFVYGDTPSETRDRIKQRLIKKELRNVISTVVWKEGINIPTLNVCINAAGGKSEITTLQSVGRSLTKAEGKDKAIIVDIFDPSHNYLISHFGERISIYCDQGWL